MTSQTSSSATTYIKYTSPCQKIKGVPVKVKSFRNAATYQKLGGGVPPPPPPLYHGGGMNLRVRPRVKIGVFAAVAVVDAKAP